MTKTAESENKAMPKGGRKGGTQFPRSTLDEAFGYAKKLVNKTHVSPLPRDAVYAGVVGAKSGLGNMRISAMKLYGYLEGKADGYSSSAFAKQSAAAPTEELPALHRQAALRPAIFRDIYATFKGDVVSVAKLRQRAAELGVHPTETETCIKIYLSSLTSANLLELDGDKANHFPDASPSAESATPLTSPENNENSTDDSDKNDPQVESDRFKNLQNENGSGSIGPKAIFNVNIALDSSMDFEKLQKQLALLKQFGVI